LDRSTAQGYEHRFFFFGKWDLIGCHGLLLILANRSGRLQCLKETRRVHLGIHFGEEVVALAEVVADYARVTSQQAATTY
jgi:hypothetical protein